MQDPPPSMMHPSALARCLENGVEGQSVDFHLERGLRLHMEPEHKSLHAWAINGIDSQDQKGGHDQGPWGWTLWFTATACEPGDTLKSNRSSGLGRPRRHHAWSRSARSSGRNRRGAARMATMSTARRYCRRSAPAGGSKASNSTSGRSPIPAKSGAARPEAWNLPRPKSTSGPRTQEDGVEFYLFVKQGPSPALRRRWPMAQRTR